MKSKTSLLYVAVAVLAIGSVLWLLGISLSSNDDRTRAAAPSPLALQWRVGSAQRYDVALDSLFRSAAGSDAMTPQSLRIQLRGILEFHTLEVSATEAAVGLRLSSLEALVGESRNTAMERGLKSPFRVRFDRDGLPNSFEFPAALAADHRTALENVVRTFQVAVRPGATWMAQEPHPSGTYEASYARKSPSHLDKTKLRYLDPGDKRGVVLPTLASKESIRIDTRSDWIASMTVHETVHTADSSGVTGTVTNDATLKLRPDRGASGARAIAPWGFAAADAAARQRPSSKPALSRKEGMVALGKSIAALDAAAKGRTEWIHAMRDLLIADPGLASVLLESLMTLELTDRTRADLYLVFELAGTPESQAVLASVMQNRESKRTDGLRAIVALSGVAKPTRASIDVLWQTAQTEGSNLASTATLALGTVGGTLRATENADYGTLRSRLLRSAHDAPNARTRVSVILALGNTADPTLAREVVPLFADDNPRVRSAVARAAGRLDTNEVAEELMQHFERERNSVVRASLAGALVSWESPPPSAMKSMREAILSTTDEPARFQIARVLAANVKGNPENRDLLQALLRTEQSKRIRQHIAEALVAARAN